MKILLIEDDQLLRELYDDTLTSEGHQILSARHAQEAVTMLEEYGADLVIMDMMLPGHNGLEVLHEMQSYEDWQFIPVLILSSRMQQEFGITEKEWRSLGVAKYLYKPATKLSKLIEEVAYINDHATL